MDDLNKSTILLSADSAATKLGIGLTTFYKLIKQGQIPSVRFSSRLVRYRLCDLEALITSLQRGGR